ncbi:uncharacterized protein [Trachinotus anak]|uniref:uncharacterized protein isoform X2 n=1 Tax=Trachinotus anak TaxID=443729 RepID=UPI0039F1E15F
MTVTTSLSFFSFCLFLIFKVQDKDWDWLSHPQPLPSFFIKPYCKHQQHLHFNRLKTKTRNLPPPEQSSLLETAVTMKLQSWLMLVFMLEAGTSLTVPEDWLTRIMWIIRGEYKINGHFCLIANIPLNQRPDKFLDDVLQNDRYDRNVRNVIGEREEEVSNTYIGTNMIVARVNEPEHAELRALQHLESLSKSQKQPGKLLLVYSYLSPCSQCTNWDNGNNILEPFQDLGVIYWDHRAFAFTKVFDKPLFGKKPTKKDVKETLEQLKRAEFKENVFRCDTPRTSSHFQCHGCFPENQVSDFCLDNDADPQRRGGSSPAGGQRGSSPSWGQRGSSPSFGQGGSSPSFRQGGSRPMGGQQSYRGAGGQQSFFGAGRQQAYRGAGGQQAYMGAGGQQAYRGAGGQQAYRGAGGSRDRSRDRSRPRRV